MTRKWAFLDRATLWSLALNILTKAQSVAVIASGFALGGVVSIGVLSAATSAAALATGVADFGFGSDCGRFLASNPTRANARYILRRVPPRSIGAAALGPAGYFIVGSRVDAVSPLLLSGIAALSFGLASTTIFVQMLNGLARFGHSSVVLGGIRLVAGSASVGVALTWHSLPAVAWALAVGELVAGAVLYICLRTSSAGLPRGDKATGPGRQYLWLGIGGTINVLVNRSDVLLVGLVANPQVLGIYSVASQLQNAVSTLAQSPSIPLPIYVAQSSDGARHRTLKRGAVKQTLILACVATLSALGLYFAYLRLFPVEESLTSTSSILAVLLATMSATLIALSAVELAMALGLRRYRAVGLARIVDGVIAIVAIALLASKFGAIGAALAAVIRDASLLLLGAAAARASWLVASARVPGGPRSTRLMTAEEAAIALRVISDG